jgi:hypothetical protein
MTATAEIPTTVAIIAPMGDWDGATAVQTLKDELSALGLDAQALNEHREDPRHSHFRDMAHAHNAGGLVIANFDPDFEMVIPLDKSAKSAAREAAKMSLAIFLAAPAQPEELGLEGPAELITFGTNAEIISDRLLKIGAA